MGDPYSPCMWRKLVGRVPPDLPATLGRLFWFNHAKQILYSNDHLPELPVLKSSLSPDRFEVPRHIFGRMHGQPPTGKGLNELLGPQLMPSAGQ